MVDWILSLDEFHEFGQHCLRLFIAALLGGLVGIERQLFGRWAGLRTHMMVALGAAIFTIAALSVTPNDSNEVTRVIQGIAAGIGFLGAGTILKLSSQMEVKGLTTASSIWIAAAMGTVAGLGEYALAAASGLVALLVLSVLRPFTKVLGREPRMNEKSKK